MREEKGVKQDTIAQLTTMSGAQVSRIENGKRRATRSFVLTVDDHLEASGALLSLWEDLNKDGHPVPIWFDWPQVEADATMLVCWQHSIIPGLAQTPAYALAILRDNEEAADARIKRQKILLVDQQDHSWQGVSLALCEQLEHLIALSMLPNVTLQVVLASSEHDGNLGAFVIATMDDRSEVAYIETAVRGITTDNPAELAILARTLVDLRSRTLTQEMSRELIRKVIKERWS